MAKVYHIYYEIAIGKCRFWDILLRKFIKKPKTQKNEKNLGNFERQTRQKFKIDKILTKQS